MQRKKIMLITPPYHSGVVECAGTWVNLGFIYIAGSLRKGGYEVYYYDAMSKFHNHDDIKNYIYDINPHFVATTAFTASINDALKVLNSAKDVNPNVITILGNVHPTFCYEEILKKNHEVVDFIVRGEGEETLLELLKCLDSGDKPEKVPGIAFYRGGVIVTKERPYIEDLDSLFPAWDLVEWDIYSYKTKPGSTLAIVSSSRGCKQKCSFCSQQLFWKRSWRGRSPENFVSELEYLNKKFRVDVAMICDEIPTLDRERWIRILDLLIERNLGIDLLLETRVDDILRDEDIMGRYREAGITHIYVGVESINQATLDMFKKDIKVEDSKKAIEIINNHDIISETSFVLGMPDDTVDTVRNSVELAKYYDPDMAFFLSIAPWPYAEIYPEVKEYIITYDYSKYNLVTPVIKPKNMSIEELDREIEFASMNFFMNKLMNLEKLSSYKRDFMIKVMDVLMNNSYLGDKVKELKDGNIPDEMKDILLKIGGII
jgi:anaerobic magnesium-protoporphyrin IX monomethyl ester cyclase